MLKLADFFHLPQIDAIMEQIVASGPGLMVVAGLDPRPAILSTPGGLLPSGRSTLFRILMRELLTADTAARCVVVTGDRSSIRIPRQLKERVKISVVEPPYTYTGLVTLAAHQGTDLLVIDRLDYETLPLALDAGQNGLRVLSQIETVFRGTDVIRHLKELGAQPEQIGGISWILSVQRMSTLCAQCKEPVSPVPAQIARLRQRYPHLAPLVPLEDQPWFTSRGCVHCAQTGRQGDVMTFDVFRADADTTSVVGQLSVLSMEEYVLRLALQGYLSLEDTLLFESDLFRRTYHMLNASESALTEANSRLERKLVEIQAANRVLEQRTQALISLGDVGQALISSTDIDDLAARVCHYACELCGADRAILYYLHAEDHAEVLAVSGWDAALRHQHLSTDALLMVSSPGGPSPFYHRPPGIPANSPDLQSAQIRAGLYVPLLAQGQQVGFMIVHSTRKSRFEPGQVSLLQTFAHQAAVAVQRAGLIDQLRAKIDQLEAAQAELAKKERLERELELARQVQQSVLPRTFPQIAGYQFAARNEPARRVGGDFYDVILLDDNAFGLAIADVSDKGMPAALYMALTRSLLRTEARRARSPRTVLENVNQLLLELGEPNMFVSVFYGVMDRSERLLTYVRAGHDRPLLARGGTVQALGGRGVALGIFDLDRFRPTEEQILLSSRDRLLLYTDGLTDIQTPAGHFFGQERLSALFQSAVDQHPAQVCDDLFAALHEFQGEADQYDDMTMLVMAVD